MITVLYQEKDIPEEDWKQVFDLAVALINRMPASHAPYLSAYERLTGVQPLPYNVEKELLGEKEDAYKETRFKEGELVLFRYPLWHYGKVAIKYEPYKVQKVISPFIYRLKALRRSHDSGCGTHTVDGHSSCIRHMPVSLQKRLRSPPAKEEMMRKVVRHGEKKEKDRFVIWRNKKKKQLFLGRVIRKSRKQLKVHYYGSYGKGALMDRFYRPAMRRPDEQAVMFTYRNHKHLQPDLYDVEKANVAYDWR
uniref:Uncharacterized protein n=1 Tax=Chromera velia CCMP2878 TaxID=1169474 RepID=A0A0G4G0D9_9ALVE|eukprot:Cvel_19616.t1-p1 / transcript=Cvel_19616.t1 / gene=Cvel_19616 / organism=Chromera_velia_CCMP2878 / gene_product=hypothetical protein / transcript_product=hypothetical protein / location=Cvel_scaffold1706:26811-27557(+) / protein_length=249 / sequence_SO=supercontig / SO=protein_coding / is_pseudo=false